MKTNFTLSLILISILTFVIFVAAAPQEGKRVSLRDVAFSKNSLIIRFTVTGFTKLSELKGSVIVNKQPTLLNCKFDNVKTVKCVAPQMNKFSGYPARIWFAGSVFYTQIPFLDD
jgi:hypothetical protein